MVQRGLQERLNGTAVELDEATYGQKLNTVAQQRLAASAVREETAAAEYIAKMAAEPGSVTTDRASLSPRSRRFGRIADRGFHRHRIITACCATARC